MRVQDEEALAAEPLTDAGTWLYVVQAGAAGPVKIGTTTNLPRRVAELQVGNAAALTVLLKIPGDGGDEVRLHRRFARLRERGEWFRPDPEILAWIEAARASRTP
jgi:hypothetical protein